jgi:hypothetical protein
VFHPSGSSFYERRKDGLISLDPIVETLNKTNKNPRREAGVRGTRATGPEGQTETNGGRAASKSSGKSISAALGNIRVADREGKNGQIEQE